MPRSASKTRAMSPSGRMPENRLEVIRAIEEAGGTIEEFHTEAPGWESLVHTRFNGRGDHHEMLEQSFRLVASHRPLVFWAGWDVLGDRRQR